MKSLRAQRESRNVFKVLKRPPVALGMAACALFFMGQFELFTYIRPFLETVTRVSVSTLSLVLLVMGAGPSAEPPPPQER
jgi:predicted MFS family arabinose efflux permease